MKTCLNCNSQNPAEARYCAHCRFTLDWSTTATDDLTHVLPPTAGPPLEVAMGPPELQVRPGGSGVFQARVANRGTEPARATLHVAGDAAPYASVQPAVLDLAPGATGAATVNVSVHSGAGAARLPVVLYVAQEGGTETSVAAQASLVVEPAVSPAGGNRGRFALIAAGLAAVVLVAVVIATGSLGGDDDGDGGDTRESGGSVDRGPDESDEGGAETDDEDEGRTDVSGRVVTAPSGLCAHTAPNLDPGSKVPPHGSPCLAIPNNGDFRVECKEADGLLKLRAPEKVAGHWIGSGHVELDGEPPPC